MRNLVLVCRSGLLALGLSAPAEPDCKCSTAKRANGWCGHCKAGQVGKLRYTDKQAYEHALAARETLRRAVKAAATCEACAVAMVTDGKGAKCGISFKDGKPLAEAQSQDKPPEKP